MWRFAEAKAYILEAGNLITAAEAERRVLILENPGLRGKSSITTSLYAGIQLVMPGEIAPPLTATASRRCAWYWKPARALILRSTASARRCTAATSS